ncbi:MAG TPA: PEP/pyruvate-binding domain-containing protein [Candidatus Limnocylindria bacterium]
MTSNWIRHLADVRMTDVREVGGKAAGIGELFAAGARVPGGVVLPANVAAMTPEQRQRLLAVAVDELGAGPFAGRSSGVVEDGLERSFAGMFETVLDVDAGGLQAAADRVLASADAARAAAYEPVDGARLAVIVQCMVSPLAAGVVLTADPITGDRGTVVVNAVRGLGDRLVSGAAVGDEWVVRGEDVDARRLPEQAIDRDQALEIAAEARRIAHIRGMPQDIEWAIDTEGTLWILQARPMTALPPDVSWVPAARGAYHRSFRFGEWIGEPVTPLFESWLLLDLEIGLHAWLKQELGQGAPLPHHVIVNGWYFYSLNWISPGSMLRSLPSIVWHVARQPRAAAGVIPSTVRHSFPIMERRWRADLQPRYRAAVTAAAERVEVIPVSELPGLINEMAALAGEYYGSVVALAGAAYKMEINLAKFYRKHLEPALGGSHLPLLAGIEAPSDPEPHAVVSLDWWHTSGRQAGSPSGTAAHGRAVAGRQAAEAAAREALASSPRRLRDFESMLADGQHLVSIREEQVREWTLPWPVMRRAVVRIGESLVSRGLLESADDVFFLYRDEVMGALDGGELPSATSVHSRRTQREEQARLVPPMAIGKWNPMLKRFLESYPAMFGARPSDHAIVSGVPASPGIASGTVRTIRGPHEFDQLQPGEVLVAPFTAPAWTPLFTRAAAVVTDVGSAAAHASIVAREYGIPAVVGCGDATARLRTGMHVTVDGTTGNVEPAAG